jgi:endonuclease III
MAKLGKREVARRLLQRYPKSRAEALHIDVGRNTPGPLYQWLIACLLFSARIAADNAQRAAQALFARGWRTPKKMVAATWKARVTVLNRAGYARYDESTSRYIADATTLLLDRYGGDLRALRDKAARDPRQERALLKQFKGIGDVGADIFFRHAQVAWDELYPFADRKAIDAARKLGLGGKAKALARLVTREELPRLLSALASIDAAREAGALAKPA